MQENDLMLFLHKSFCVFQIMSDSYLYLKFCLDRNF